MPPQRTKRGTMTQQELDTILESHERWLATAAKDDVQADLSNLDLRDLVFRGASLKNAILRNSDLRGIDLHEMDLSGANLSDAELIGCNLKKAVLRDADLSLAKLKDAQLCGADLCGAILHEVNLTNVHGLVECQLAGTDLLNAEVPANLSKFDALRKVTDVSVQARTLLWVTVGACLFTVITMFVTTDAAIVAHFGNTLLPVVQINVPIFVFFFVAPLVLLGLYLYLHFQLQYLWSGLASLPSVFPDGISLDDRAYPLFLVGLVRWYVPILKKSRPPLCWLQVASSIAAVWALVPITLFLFWLRYVRMHETGMTFWHILVLTAATAFAVASYTLTVQTLSGERNPRSCADEQECRRKSLAAVGARRAVIAGVLVVIVCGLLSVAAFEGWMVNSGFLTQWISVDRFLRERTCADFSYGEISHKPEDWLRLSDENRAQLIGVKGALLSKVDLRGATAVEAFLANATLSGADLQAADFSQADLRASVLNEANLQRIQLRGADLRGAHLDKAKLQCADLKSAQLTRASLSEAKLNGANLYGADLQEAILTEAEFLTDEVCRAAPTKRDFKAGDRAKTILCEAKLQRADLTSAKLQQADLGYASLQGTIFEGAYLKNANLKGANLAGAKLRKANLNDVDFSGAWFQETELHGADLSQAKNLTDEQLTGAKWDRETTLPPRLDKAPEKR